NQSILEKLVKLWKAPVYVFFSPVPDIAYDDDSHVYHAFHCLNCPHKISRYPDMADAGSTGALQHHIQKCWGDEVLAAADAMNDLTKSHEVVDKELRKHKPKNGSIVSMLKRFGSKVISYSTRAHTKTENMFSPLINAESVHWCAESLQPFNLFTDYSFKCLMKTGWPQHYILYLTTVSHDTKTIFA
ncbi:hypothetical protein ARMSODRAFT_890327, partial [Armillaria solidipes]